MAMRGPTKSAMADPQNGDAGSRPYRCSQVLHRRSQDPRNGWRQTAIGRDIALSLDSNVCDQRRARRQDLRPRTNAHRHPGGREGDTSFVSEGGEVRQPGSKSHEDKSLSADDERQPW